jgi:hypothetical protein
MIDVDRSASWAVPTSRTAASRRPTVRGKVGTTVRARHCCAWSRAASLASSSSVPVDGAATASSRTLSTWETFSPRTWAVSKSKSCTGPVVGSGIAARCWNPIVLIARSRDLYCSAAIRVHVCLPWGQSVGNHIPISSLWPCVHLICMMKYASALVQASQLYTTTRAESRARTPRRSHKDHTRVPKHIQYPGGQIELPSVWR